MDTEVEVPGSSSRNEEEEEKKKGTKPPCSYGSMKSDPEEEEGNAEDVAQVCTLLFPAVPPDPTAPQGTRLEIIHSGSPHTVYTTTTTTTTTTTQLTKPPNALVIDTRSSDLDEFSENDEEEELDELLIINSPEPPEPIEPDDTEQTDDTGQPGALHPELDLPHIFKSIQSVLTGLTCRELLIFKYSLCQWKPVVAGEQLRDGDILDFVDRMLEVFGPDLSVLYTIRTLESIRKQQEAGELQNRCKRALIRFHLKEQLIRKHSSIHEGVVRAGRLSPLDDVYVEPQISTRGYGGVDPSHELRPRPPSPLLAPGADAFVGLNDLFRLQRDDGQPVRTVLTTGIPGIGMTVSVAKFCLDWAKMRTNRDLQFVIKLSFRSFWYQRQRSSGASQMSIMEMIGFCHPDCKDMECLEEEDCRFLIIMDSFDCYQASLDWENAPVVTDNHTGAHPDVLIVNIIRGTALRGARVWILGRRAAVSQIPSGFIDVVTEIQGFSDEMKDEFLTKRFSDADLARNIVAHHKRLPMLRALARQPFVCWMAATVFEHAYRYRDYGRNPPRLTPFYINMLIVQMNRRLQFYEGRSENELRWSGEDKLLLVKMGQMAFKMLERNAGVFYEEDVMEHGLKLAEVTVFSGLCTEIPVSAADRRRTFCFIHLTFQEFMAALYVFVTFHSESRNVLESGVPPQRSAADLLHSAVERTLCSPLGRYDMFLRLLCGLLNPECHDKLLKGFLFDRSAPRIVGLEAVRRLLQKSVETARDKNRERLQNLMECLRESTQGDD